MARAKNHLFLPSPPSERAHPTTLFYHLCLLSYHLLYPLLLLSSTSRNYFRLPKFPALSRFHGNPACPAVGKFKSGHVKQSWQTGGSPSLQTLLSWGTVTRPIRSHLLHCPMQAMQVSEGTCLPLPASRGEPLERGGKREDEEEERKKKTPRPSGFSLYCISFPLIAFANRLSLCFFYRQRASRACEVRFFVFTCESRDARRSVCASAPRLRNPPLSLFSLLITWLRI